MSVGETRVREALAREYEDLGRLIQRAYAEYTRPGDPLWDRYFSMLADVAGRAALVAVASGHIVGTATEELDKTIEEPRTSSLAGPASGSSPWIPQQGVMAAISGKWPADRLQPGSDVTVVPGGSSPQTWQAIS